MRHTGAQTKGNIPDSNVEVVVAALSANHFAVLSTVDEAVTHSAGVSYGAWVDDCGLAIYVMTRRHLRKARNIASNPNVSLVVPIPRRWLWFVPPATIQLHGRAEILDWTDPIGTHVFRAFWVGRRILRAYQESHDRGETRICFLRITLEPVATTYMVGSSIWAAMRHMESAAGTVELPSPQPSELDVPSAIR